MLLPRRKFLQCLTGLVAAPAVIRVADLMPVRVVPFYPYMEFTETVTWHTGNDPITGGLIFEQREVTNREYDDPRPDAFVHADFLDRVARHGNASLVKVVERPEDALRRPVPYIKMPARMTYYRDPDENGFTGRGSAPPGSRPEIYTYAKERSYV